MPPGSARLCSRAAIARASPKGNPSSNRTSPRCTLILRSMFPPLTRSDIRPWIESAHDTASTALSKSENTPSPGKPISQPLRPSISARAILSTSSGYPAARVSSTEMQSR